MSGSDIASVAGLIHVLGAHQLQSGGSIPRFLYALAMRCPVTAIVLSSCCTMSETDVGYAATRPRRSSNASDDTSTERLRSRDCSAIRVLRVLRTFGLWDLS
eukprot:1416881-Rhodomonas_salina.6